jgi:hypothetical protein
MRKSKTTLLFLCALFFAISPMAIGQVNHLEKKISIDLKQVRLKNALPKIAESGDFLFSYNSEIIPGDSLVSVQAENQPVNQVLKDLMGPGIRYKVLGNHVILLNNQPEKRAPKRESNPEYTITGYIYDAQTGEIITSASIYEVEGMFVSATDAKGYYSLTVPGDQEQKVLSYSKAGYIDTLIVVKPKETSSRNISLTPKPTKLNENQMQEVPMNGLNERTLVKALVPVKARITAENIPVEEQRWAQLSLFPFIGSNRFVSGLITNRFSINLFAGYAGGLKGIELGGFLNIVRKEMSGVQLSGFGNIVGNKSNGVQLSGFFNYDGGSFTGLQGTGFSNVVMDTVRGVQLAGFSNVLRGPMYGTQISGFSNFTSQNVDGLQASGFANIALKDVKVAQLSGFGNFTSGANKGWQVAGFMNYAKELRGVQIAPFNFADTASTGVPVGLFSYVAKGYHPLELTANELFPLNVTFKTGVSRFYNIFTAGIQRDLLTVGCGFGTQIKISKVLGVSMDLTGNYLADNRNFLRSLGAHIRFAPTLDIRLAKHLTLLLGPTLNGFAGLDHADAGTGDFPFIFSYPIKNLMIASTPVSIRLGATAGFRF